MTDAYRWSFHSSPEGQKKSVLFLHGFMGCKEDWKDVGDSLGDTFRVLTVDLPGHGSTQSVEPDVSFGMENTARELIELLDSLNMYRCHVVGYSMGGRLALYLGIRYPNRVDRLVLESASPGLAEPAARDERRQQDRELEHKLETVSFSRFLEDWYAQPLFSMLKRHPQFPDLLQRRMRNRPTELAKSLRQMGTGAQPSLWESLKSLRQPTLFVAGNKDIKFREIAVEMADRCPTGRAVIIENSGHAVHFEQPKLYIDVIQAFFNESR